MILAALRLLERAGGPVIIEDFTEDDPRAQPDPNWQAPPVPVSANGSADVIADRLGSEIPLLQGAHDRWFVRHGRTAVGLSALSVDECGRYVADWVRGKAPPSPRDGFSAPLMLRFAVDDLKAYYLEAGAGAERPSSRQVGDWFWDETAGGAAIHALRTACLASDDERLKLIAGNFMVPAARVR